jgi:hypothetical protein
VGQWFLITRSSLGWNPSVLSTIQQQSRISDRVLMDVRRHQQNQAATSNRHGRLERTTDLAEALGNKRETLQFALAPQRDAPFAYTG